MIGSVDESSIVGDDDNLRDIPFLDDRQHICSSCPTCPSLRNVNHAEELYDLDFLNMLEDTVNDTSPHTVKPSSVRFCDVQYQLSRSDDYHHTRIRRYWG